MLKKRIYSFRCAFEGIATLFRKECNARIHLVAAVVAGVLGFVLDISPVEWVVVVLCIGAVIAMEAMNSAVEAVCDRVTLERDDMIKLAKDYAAAAVLIVAIAAATVGGVIFLPKIVAVIYG